MSEGRENLEPGGLSDDERQVERLLASLPVSDSRLDRDRTMFLAGRATALAVKQRPRTVGRWIWPGVTICSAAAGLVVGLLIAQKGSVVGVGERDVTQAVAPPGTASDASGAIASHDRLSSPASNDRAPDTLNGSPSLLVLRSQMLGGAGGTVPFAEDDKLALAAIRAAGARAERKGAPVTYRDFIGHLPDDEEHPRL
jgi:hypothetical protein